MIIEEKYSQSQSFKYKIKFFFFHKKVTLRLVTKLDTKNGKILFDSNFLDSDLEKEIAESLLGLGCRLPKNENEIDGKFYRYKWNLELIHNSLFKTRYGKYKEKHPNLDLYKSEKKSNKKLIKRLSVVISFIVALSHIIRSFEETWNFIVFLTNLMYPQLMS